MGKVLNSQSFDGINVYPIPSNGLVHLETDIEAGQAVVMDMIGNVMYSTSIRKGDNKLDLGHLPAGNYLIKASGKNKVETRKITIVK